MTLPASGAISLSQIANEVGLSLPISINHAWLLALIGKSGLPVSFSDFYGKTGRWDGSASPSGGQTIQLNNAPLFGGTLNYAFSGGTGASGNIIFNTVPQWTGKLKLTNNTTGASLVMSQISGGSNQWGGSPVPANLMRNGFTDSFTITPSN